MKDRFGGAVWTDHALDRIKSRLIPERFAIEAFVNPDSKVKNGDGYRMVKKIEDKTITLAAKQNEKEEWVILSLWMSPPAPGTKDDRKRKQYKEYKKGSVGKKIWLSILRQLGL